MSIRHAKGFGPNTHTRSESQDGELGESAPSDELAYKRANRAVLMKSGFEEISRSDLVRVHADRLDGTNRISYAFKDGQLQVLLR